MKSDEKLVPFATLLYKETHEKVREIVYFSKNNIKTIINNAIVDYYDRNIKKFRKG